MIKALNEAFNTRTVSVGAKITLVAMANCANERQRCWPGIARLITWTQLSQGAVYKMIKELEKAGLIEEKHGRKGKFWIVFPDLELGKSEVEESSFFSSGEKDSPQENTVYKGTITNHYKSTCEDLVLSGGDDLEAIPKGSKPEQLFVHLLPNHGTEVMVALGEFAIHRRQKRNPLTEVGVRRLCRKIRGWESQDIIDRIEGTLEAGWSAFVWKEDTETGPKEKDWQKGGGSKSFEEAKAEHEAETAKEEQERIESGKGAF